MDRVYRISIESEKAIELGNLISSVENLMNVTSKYTGVKSTNRVKLFINDV